MVKITIVTHDGGFHADEVFAVAALQLQLKGKEVAVIRTRDGEVLEKADFVVDVGGVYDSERNRFDHHQIGGAGVRSNKIPYAAFGLVWKKFGSQLSGGTSEAQTLDDSLVAPLDARDNGVDIATPLFEQIFPYDISDAVRAFRPTWEEEGTNDNRFNEAVRFAHGILAREIARVIAKHRSERLVRSAYENSSDKRLVVFDGDYSWKEILARYSEPLYVVHSVPHSLEKEWHVYCVRDNPHQFENRRDLPEKWAGLRDEELQHVTGIADAIFCHRNRFMAVARSKQGAVALAQKALE